MEIKKVLVITNIPNPYRIPLFNELQQQFSQNNVQLKVVFGSKGFRRIKSIVDMNACKFDYEILSSFNIPFGNSEKIITTYSGLYKTIRRFNPEKIITIGYSIATVKLWLRSFFKKTKYIIWSGSIISAGKNSSWLRQLQRKLLVKRASGFIAYGTKAKETFLQMGAPAEKISIAINTVDTDFFEQETRKIREAETPDKVKHLTYVGYLTKRKNVQSLLNAVSIISLTRKDFVLDIIGDGKKRKKLEHFVERNHLSSFVKFHGFKQKQELPEFLAISDCFLFQTSFDIWGLVLNEAMAAGLPCLSSIYAGAAYDLIQEGETGFKVDFSDTSRAVEKINWILDHPIESKKMGENAGRFIKEKVNLSSSAAGFLKAIQFS